MTPFTFVALLLVIILTIWLACSVLSRRRWAPPALRPNIRIVIGQMAMVASQNLPMATGLMLDSEGERGKTGRVLRQIARLLAEGRNSTPPSPGDIPSAPGSWSASSGRPNAPGDCPPPCECSNSI